MSTIGAGTRIEAFSHLDDATIGAGCRVGPYARFRPGASLAEDVHIGNFVEVKASHVGTRREGQPPRLYRRRDGRRQASTSAPGTIIANYDGANKHRTVIEDGVSIGSNCVLVAPVKIGKGATIGAGSTITMDAPEGELTLARTRQVTISAGSGPVRKRQRSEPVAEMSALTLTG